MECNEDGEEEVHENTELLQQEILKKIQKRNQKEVIWRFLPTHSLRYTDIPTGGMIMSILVVSNYNYKQRMIPNYHLIPHLYFRILVIK